MTDDGRKLPITRYGGTARSNDPSTWLTLREAQALALDGVLLALTRDMRLLVVDLDDVLQVNRIINPKAHEFVMAAQSYTEISPSRHGLHVWLELDTEWVPTRSKLDCGEVYAHKRFMSVTGLPIRYDGTYAVIDHDRSFPLRKVSEAEARQLLSILGYVDGYVEPEPAVVAPALTKWQLAGLLKNLASAREGERNNRLFWTANRLREAGVAQVDAERLLMPVAAATGLPEREIASTIASAYRRAI